MKYRKLVAVASMWVLLVSFGDTAWAGPWMGHLVVKDQQVWAGGRSGNYGTVKYFLDESQNESIPIEITVQVYGDGQPRNALEVQVFSNINRRDHAKVWESASQAGGPNSYYLTYPMSYTSDSGNNFVYRANLNLTKTGAYRLTTRFRINGGPWLWHNDFQFDGVNQRDCAVVVSPRKVLDLSIYEVNPLVVEARPGGGFDQRSTFEDFTDHDGDGFDPFNLSFVKNTLGFNTIWPPHRRRARSETPCPG